MRRIVVSALIAASALALWVAPASATGNGEAAKSPTRILADAKAATNGTSTVNISGTVATAGHRVSLNIVSGHGAGGGTVSRDGETFRVVVTPPNIYLTADAATWTKVAGNAATGQLMADKWIQTTTDNTDFGDFPRLLDITALTSTMTPTGTLTKGAVTTFRGKQAIPLIDNTSKDPGTMYVAATGRPYILGIVSPKRDSHLLFRQYGSAKPPAAPTNSISLSQLQQQPSGNS